MKTIYKYFLQQVTTQLIKLPSRAEILCVQVQHESPQLWASVDTDNPMITKEIGIFGTGEEVNTHGFIYIDTFQLMAGRLVFHVFDMGEN